MKKIWFALLMVICLVGCKKDEVNDGLEGTYWGTYYGETYGYEYLSFNKGGTVDCFNGTENKVPIGFVHSGVYSISNGSIVFTDLWMPRYYNKVYWLSATVSGSNMIVTVRVTDPDNISEIKNITFRKQ